ncbi:PocR ligand-binding domain-containing protein [Clostridium sp.]|uniref:PocR ligand-binding domain-containing protein n=1 Tax=Clostridium sp. TaxID=1506 RepID=UPI003A5BAD49
MKNFLDQIKIGDVLNKNFLQQFQDYFSDSLNVASICVDLEGTPITKPSNFSDFCMHYTRSSKEGLKRCMECDRIGGERAAKTGKASIYKCHAGLVDFAAPIMVHGKQIGSFLGGQVLTKSPDENHFRIIAKEINVDPDKYIEALHKISIVPEDRIRTGANFLFFMCQNIAELGFQGLLIKNVAQELNTRIENISSLQKQSPLHQ